MSSVKSELIQLCEVAARKFDLPLVKQVYMPEPRPARDKDSEFGIVVLEDGSSGLYYAWMGEGQSGMNERYAAQDFEGLNPLELVQFYSSTNEADRSLGLAAINAISQFVFRRADFRLTRPLDSMGELEVVPGDHVGMVGYFPSLVRRLREQNVRLTVIERKTKFIQNDAMLKVTLDAKELLSCNKVLSTATTLLNDSIDEMLEYTLSAELVIIIGPTAGFFPDPLFKRGVSVVGGSEIVDAEMAISKLTNEQGLGDSAEKYIVKRSDYPGAKGLFEKSGLK
ncbi:MAG: hypothetical protein ACI9SC_000533 [Gammaproteobacteria bacterium]|jgi:uncharacterized protein (DUF4213/DUF364 family)